MTLKETILILFLKCNYSEEINLFSRILHALPEQTGALETHARRGTSVRVSIAMCTYNGEKFLKEQLCSIASQASLPDELVVCDDGSTDTTLPILRHYASSVAFPVRIYCNASRLGFAKNFEQAISLTDGDIIVLSDQDDVWQKDKLQISVQALAEDHKAGYVFSDAIIIDEMGEIIHHSLWEQVVFDQRRRGKFSLGPMDQVEVLLKGNVVTGATMALRASLKAHVLPVAELWKHDEWIALVSSLCGARGIQIEKPLIQYRWHPAQAVGVRPPGVQFLLKRAWQSFTGNPQTYEANALALRQWNASYTTLQRATSQAATLLPLLEAKVAHLALRAELYRRSRLTRLPVIVVELIRGGYHHHAAGSKSVLKDLLVPMLSNSHSAADT